MSLIEGNFANHKYKSINDEIAKLTGDLSVEDTHYQLMKFLRANLAFAFNLLTGGELYPFQVIKLNMMLNRDYVIDISSRGLSKSWLAAVFCIFYCLFHPGHTIIILSPSFRQSQGIFNYIEKIIDVPDAKFVKDIWSCRKSTSIWEGNIGSSKILVLPLAAGGGKIRGPRAQAILIDEALEFPDAILEEVVQPFLVTNFDPMKKQKIVDLEEQLMKKGELSQKDRIKFPNPKLILLSSGCYKFQDLNQRLEKYVEYITDPKYVNSGLTYGLVNFSYEIAPSALLSREIIESQKESMSESQFRREYGAQNVDDSAGYFSMKKMEACTEIHDPILEIIGDPNSEYILGIDPNYKDSEDSDHFAMCLLKISPDMKYAHIVHQYAIAGVDLESTCNYLHYLLTHFNIVYICMDEGGASQVIQYVNSSKIFENHKPEPIKLQAFDGEADYNDPKALIKARNSYNKSSWKILHIQSFMSKWIQAANESLQTAFDHKKIWFSAIPTEDKQLQKLLSSDIPISKIQFTNDKKVLDDKENKMIDFIDFQGDLLRLVKQECALIELSTTANGNQSFDLPRSMRHMTGPKKPRKDSYTALLLANWGFRCYRILKDKEHKPIHSHYRPRLA